MRLTVSTDYTFFPPPPPPPPPPLFFCPFWVFFFLFTPFLPRMPKKALRFTVPLGDSPPLNSPPLSPPQFFFFSLETALHENKPPRWPPSPLRPFFTLNRPFFPPPLFVFSSEIWILGPAPPKAAIQALEGAFFCYLFFSLAHIKGLDLYGFSHLFRIANSSPLSPFSFDFGVF